MYDLQPLRADHADAVRAFEVANRAYFARSVTDRGDMFFDEFFERHGACLAEQEAGVCRYHVLVDGDGAVVGRFNLYRVAAGTAEVGYRVAEHVSGRGVATSTLVALCRLAGEEYGSRTLSARTGRDNLASERVLEKAGFAPVGPVDVAGRPGTAFELRLS